jgi:hypothetical protein
MFLSQTFSNSGPPARKPPDILSRTVGRELLVAAQVRENKDTISSALQIKGPKQAEALKSLEIKTLRSQISALSEELLENNRMGYLLEQNNKKKHLQDFQCTVLIKIEKLLKARIQECKEDVRKYRIGGQDRGTYGELVRNTIPNSETEHIYGAYLTKSPSSDGE